MVFLCLFFSADFKQRSAWSRCYLGRSRFVC